MVGWGVRGIEIVPSSGQRGCYKVTLGKGEAKTYDKAVFHDAIQKAAAGQRKAVKENI